ncbi:calcium-binding protein, partial [Caulobacter sp. AP07]|uniref:calcium-binding protein n=1 Tax=Caulobacter sp. AP07 TaxID=1144304 RepID=UPI001EE66674
MSANGGTSTRAHAGPTGFSYSGSDASGRAVTAGSTASGGSGLSTVRLDRGYSFLSQDERDTIASWGEDISWRLESPSVENPAAPAKQVATVTKKTKDGRTFESYISYAQVGSILGSNIARLVGTDDPWSDLALGALLSTVGTEIGSALSSKTTSARLTLAEATKKFGGDLVDAGAGAISSYLFAELVNGLGDSVPAHAVTSAGGAAVGQIASNLLHVGESVNPQYWVDSLGRTLAPITETKPFGAVVRQWNTNIGPAALNAVGSFVGTWLASELVHFDTVGGQIGASVGGAIGSIMVAGEFVAAAATVTAGMAAAAAAAATATAGVVTAAASTSTFATLAYNLGWAAGPLGAAIGAFAGYILGGLIGSLFGGKPKAWAGEGWNANTGRFETTWSYAKSGGSAAAARSLTESVTGALNGVLVATGSTLIDPTSVVLADLGLRGKSYRLGRNGGVETYADASALIGDAEYYGLEQIVGKLAGGDTYAKRAVVATLAGAAANVGGDSRTGLDASRLSGNLQIASNYVSYLSNIDAIQSLIDSDKVSVFSATWVATLAAAVDLNLDKRSYTDWIGGWNAFIDEVSNGAMDGYAVAPSLIYLTLSGSEQERTFALFDSSMSLTAVYGDTIAAADKLKVKGTGGADLIQVSGDMLQVAAGLTVQGADVSTPVIAAYKIPVAALIDAGDGDDIVRAGDLGNDVLGGAGNDKIVGGKLDDWLFGEDGDDVLFAGDVVGAGVVSEAQLAQANATFTVDAVAVTAVDGGNGDLLDGGAGNDRLYGGKGSDWLKGGDGVDALYGGAGGDILEGGAGDDQGAAGVAAVLGGAGSDQYVFGYGDGNDVIWDEADPAGVAGSTGDSLFNRISQLNAGSLTRNWAGGGSYEVDGSVKGGEDAIVFGVGVTMQNLIMKRSGTTQAPGQDLIIQLTVADPTGVLVNGHVRQVATGDSLTIKDWFESTRKVEWLRFANGDDIRIGDITSYIVGVAGASVILGTNGADWIVGTDGADKIYGLNGDDFGFGGLGNDLVSGDGNNDLVSGGAGDDVAIGGAGNDTVFGDGGNDRVTGGLGDDIVAGGKGDDVIIAGAGNDVIRYARGDGADVLIDDLVDNWDLVWQNGEYVNGYVLNANGTVSKTINVVVGAVTYFDGSKWIDGFNYDYDDATKTLKRHKGALNGVISTSVGAQKTDTLEFAVGVDIQDLMLRRVGNDLEVVVSDVNTTSGFAGASDKITIKDWWSASTGAEIRPIEKFNFVATGTASMSSYAIAGGATDGADNLVGGSVWDWMTGGGGDDILDGGGGNDILSGGEGADKLLGGSAADVLYGGAGDDILDGSTGADQMFGGSGIDIASYQSNGGSQLRAYLGAMFANGGNSIGDIYTDIEGIEGSQGGDRLGGNAGDNILRGAGGGDKLWGGAGDDTYEYNRGDGIDSIYEGAMTVEEVLSPTGALNSAFVADWQLMRYGAATGVAGDYYQYQLIVRRAADNEIVYQSRDGVDFLFPTPETATPGGASWPYADNQWRAGASRGGNASQTVIEHIVAGNGGSDTLAMGAGISLSDLTMSRGANYLKVSLDSTNYVAMFDQLVADRGVETLQLADGLAVDLTALRLGVEAATAGVDVMIGSASNNTFGGQGGDDVLSGGAGADTLDGGAGNDVLEGGTGADTLNGGTDSQTDGLAIKASDPGSYGDTIRYVTSVAAVAIDLAALTATGGDATGDVIVAVNGVSTIENVVGSDAYDDQLSGDGRANRLFGLGGNDVLDGRLGDDVLVGGAGDDTLYGGDGDDALAGEDGVDRLEGGLGKDLLSGGAGDDTLLGQGGDDQLTGDDGDDNLSGGDGADTLGGGAGVDILYGEAGDDKLVGGDGADQLYGGDGNDVLVGEAGNDLFDGGAGDDIYGFDANSGIDRVVDASGVNRVTISGVTSDRIWLTRAGDDLKIAVIGGSTVITLAGYYAASDASLMKEVALDGTSLFLGHAQSLISAMTATSVAPPTAMPTAIAAQAAPFWHAGGKAAPVVVDQALAINEDVVISGQVGAIDDDDNITGYTVVSGPTLGVLQLNAATGAWNYTPTADISGSDRFVLRVTDADNHVVQQTVSVTIAPVNDAPRNVTAPAHLSLLETAGATSLGFFTATDVDDPVSSLVYTLDDSAGGRFEITTAGELKFTNTTAIDFETAQSHTIRVRVSDPHGGSESYVVVPFNVAIEDVNERPGAPGLTSSPLMVGENVADATTTLTTDALATFSLTDPDYPGGPPPGAVTLRLVSDPNNWLVVSGNTVVFRAGLQIDFEALTAGMGILPDSDGDGLDEYVYDFTVAAFDGQLTSSTMAAWVRIEDVNEAPSTPTFSGAVAAIAENDHPVNGVQLARETLARLSSTDHDKSLAYRGVTFTVDNPDFEVFTIAASGQTPAGYGLRLTEAARLNYETKTSVTVNVRAIDGKGGVSAASPITFTITDAEDYWYGNKVVDNTNDTITGEAGRDLIYGLGGNDTLKGGAGNDELDGGIGDDTLQGDDGADLLKGGAGLDTLTGGLGDDTLEGGSEVDSLYGGAGLDTLKGEAGNDWLYGEDGNDTLSGDLGDDTLDGGVGDDLLLGGDGNDTLIGGTGADTLTGGVGADTLKGGAGADRFTGGLDADTVSYADAGGPVTVNLATGGTAGEAAGDVFLDRIEILVGSGNDDTLTGSSFGDFLYGGAGIDHIYGGVGDDWLYGDAGDDVISADDGDDRLFGGVGADTLIGGSGSDTYYIETTSGADTIQNFNSPTSDLDIISYDTGIDRTKLWFRKVGNDLYIDLLGTATTTKVANWYGQGAVNTDNKIDFLFTGPNSSNKVNIEQLVTLMATSGLVDAGATPALDQFSDFLASNAVFNTQWQGLWDGNEKPKVDPVTVPDLSENAGTISIAVKIRDAITVGMQLQVSAVSAANNLVADTSLVSILSVDSIDAAGNAIVKFKPADYKSGAFDIKVVAVDQGKLLSDPQYIRINVNSVANQPNLGFMPLVSGSFVTTSAIPLSIPATLADTDGSESLKIELMGIPSGLQLNKGTPGLDPDGNLIWTLYRDPQNGIDDLTGLQLKRVDPNLAWSQNLTVYVLAYGVERGNWKLSTPRTGSFTVDINGAPTAVSIVGGATSLSVSEDKIPGAAATIGTFTASDPDGDALTYKL